MIKWASQLASVVSFGIGVIALNAGVGGLNCAPTAYVKFEVSGDQRDIVPDPKFSLMFGNAAFTAMFLHGLHYEVDGKTTKSLKSIFQGVDKVKFSTESTDLLAYDFPKAPRAWKHGGTIPLVIARPLPQAADTDEWTEKIRQALQQNRVTIVVTTSVAPSGLACWLTKKTTSLPIYCEAD